MSLFNYKLIEILGVTLDVFIKNLKRIAKYSPVNLTMN